MNVPGWGNGDSCSPESRIFRGNIYCHPLPYRRDGEEYNQFIGRVKGNLLAVKVKIADLKDNYNLERIAAPKENDYMRLEKYRRALEQLTEA